MTNFEKIKESPLELLAVMFARAYMSRGWLMAPQKKTIMNQSLRKRK